MLEEAADVIGRDALRFQLGASLEAQDRIRAFCEEIQVAGNDYHARITAGQIVNLLAGRDANDDGDLIRSIHIANAAVHEGALARPEADLLPEIDRPLPRAA